VLQCPLQYVAVCVAVSWHTVLLDEVVEWSFEMRIAVCVAVCVALCCSVLAHRGA